MLGLNVSLRLQSTRQGTGGGASPQFPSLPLLDNFNRADAADLGANWNVDPFGYNDFSPVILGNKAAVSGGSVWGGVAWNVAPYGPDLAACFTIATPPAAQGLGPSLYWYAALYVRWQQGTTGDSYAVSVSTGSGEPGDAATDATGFYLFRSTQNFATIGIDPIQAGDKIGIVTHGSTIEGWLYRAATGRWTCMATAVDSDLSGRALINFEIFDDGGALAIDDFSATDLFPTVSLLDNFNRADGAVGGNWVNYFDDGLVIASNAATIAGANTNTGSAWDTDPYAADVAVSVTLAAAPAGDNPAITLLARQGNGAADGTVSASIYTITGTTYASIGDQENSTSAEIADFLGVGERLGLVCRGATIELWTYRSGLWERQITTTTTNTAAGSIGLTLFDTAPGLAIDNFSAVTL